MSVDVAPDRRAVLRGSAAGLILASLGGALQWTTPATAAAAAAPFRILTAGEAAWIAGLGEAIAPPARAAGLVHYLDHHLAQPSADSLLVLRYLDVPPPYIDFYRPALASLQRAFGAPPPTSDPRWPALLATLGGAGPDRWQGPPAPLFLFAMRLDAIDIAYGTRAGFARLGVDYLPHIAPETDW